MKTCRLCKATLDESMFYVTNRHGHRRTECRDCTRSQRNEREGRVSRMTYVRAGSARFREFAKTIEDAFRQGRFDRLSDRERHVMIYRYLQGKTISEVARLVGVSDTSITGISRDAIKKLWSNAA